MSYTKTNWQTGDIVTSAKLNKMETGIEDADSSVFYVTVELADPSTPIHRNTPTEAVSDRTTDEILEAYQSGKSIYAVLKEYFTPTFGFELLVPLNTAVINSTGENTVSMYIFHSVNYYPPSQGETTARLEVFSIDIGDAETQADTSAWITKSIWELAPVPETT